MASKMNSELIIKAQEVLQWRPLLDGVMGGLSSGSVIPCNDNACFTGTVRTENYGGFSSIKGPLEINDLSSFTKIEITAKSDPPAKYDFAIVDNKSQSARCQFKSSFETRSDMATTTINFNDFQGPFWRGQRVPPSRAWSFEWTDVKEIRIFALKPEIIGDFNLEIKEIRFS